MRFKTERFDVEIKMKPVGNDLMVQRPEILMRSEGGEVKKLRVVSSSRYVWKGKGAILSADVKFRTPEGTEVPKTEVLEILDHFNYKLLDPLYNEVKEEEVEFYYLNERGEPVAVAPFNKTSVLEVMNWVPSTVVDEFVISSIYELFTDNAQDTILLWEEAEKRIKEDTVGVTTYSHGRGFVEYYAFLDPIVVEDSFVWLLKLTDTKIRYDHMMKIPIKTKIRAKAPTLKTLPPIQSLIKH